MCVCESLWFAWEIAINRNTSYGVPLAMERNGLEEKWYKTSCNPPYWPNWAWPMCRRRLFHSPSTGRPCPRLSRHAFVAVPVINPVHPNHGPTIPGHTNFCCPSAVNCTRRNCPPCSLAIHVSYLALVSRVSVALFAVFLCSPHCGRRLWFSTRVTMAPVDRKCQDDGMHWPTLPLRCRSRWHSSHVVHAAHHFPLSIPTFKFSTQRKIADTRTIGFNHTGNSFTDLLSHIPSNAQCTLSFSLHNCIQSEAFEFYFLLVFFVFSSPHPYWLAVVNQKLIFLTQNGKRCYPRPVGDDWLCTIDEVDRNHCNLSCLHMVK